MSKKTFRLNRGLPSRVSELTEEEINNLHKVPENSNEVIIEGKNIYSVEEIMFLFKREFKVPTHLSKNLRHLEIYLLNSVTSNTVIKWKDFEHSLFYLEDFACDLLEILLRIEKNNKHLYIIDC